MSDLDRYLTDEVRERAAEAIASHNFDVHVPSWSIRCAGCDWSELGGVVELHDQHLADLALSAVLPGIIRQAKAEGWDEGYNAGHEDARAVQPTYPQPTLNPHEQGGQP
ncbi:hypothetical protein ACTQ2Q_09925 [Atopobiaceae bacterium LCP21S3_F11]|uniref:hypothetical protein n=1 Tax=Ellagibacter isourolithinifaciens TaxID=2137581 RepID=UPI003F8A3B22